jgi:nitroreductase
MNPLTDRKAAVDHPVLDAVALRYSPYIYEPRQVEKEKLLACFEAARWAASSFNEQPWRFQVALREDEAEFERALSCLMEANQTWARNSGVIILASVTTSFARNGKPNRVAIHDLGLAMGNFSLQATELGLAVHQMAGINPSKIRSEYELPEGVEPVTAIAVGYAGNPTQADDQDLAARDQGPRQRKPFNEFIFGKTYGTPFK